MVGLLNAAPRILLANDPSRAESLFTKAESLIARWTAASGRLLSCPADFRAEHDAFRKDANAFLDILSEGRKLREMVNPSAGPDEAADRIRRIAEETQRLQRRLVEVGEDMKEHERVLRVIAARHGVQDP